VFITGTTVFQVVACGSVFVIYWLIKHPDRCSEDINASNCIQGRVQLISDIRLNQFVRKVPDHALTIEDVAFVSSWVPAIEKHIDFKIPNAYSQADMPLRSIGS